MCCQGLNSAMTHARQTLNYIFSSVYLVFETFLLIVQTGPKFRTPPPLSTYCRNMSPHLASPRNLNIPVWSAQAFLSMANPLCHFNPHNYKLTLEICCIISCLLPFLPLTLSTHPPPHPTATPGAQTASFENAFLLLFNLNYSVSFISNVKLSNFSSSFSPLSIYQIILISFNHLQ